MTRRIFVRGLMVDARLGIHGHEQGVEQKVRVDVELEMRADAPVDDRIANVVDYDGVVAAIKAIVAQGHINLVETLAGRIADSCLADRRVGRVRVRVEKPDAVPGAAGAGVEIERTPEETRR